MEEGETEMNDNIGDPEVLRDYLLGGLRESVIQDRIEKTLMTDDEFAARIDAVEHDLVEEYLDGELSKQDLLRFENVFLATPEGRRHLRLTQNLRTFSAGVENVVPQARRSMFDWTATLSTRWLRFAALAVVVAVAGYGIWQFASRETNTQKALTEMQLAYQGQRPIEARLSAFQDHAPYSETRGPSQAADPAARDRAQSYLSDATRGVPEPGANHALAVLYLAEKNFERAQQEFTLALAAAPDDAKLNSDAGAMYLEMAKVAPSGQVPSALEYLDQSIKHLDRAISLAPGMPEPRFNKALALETLKLRDQAREAWVDYLEIDGDSTWAAEARRHIQQLEETASIELTAEELESQFLQAMRQGADDTASFLIGNNRELIKEKYIPQRLAMSYLNAPPDRRDELLSALKYAGELESKRGDPFAKEIAFFYSGLTDSKIVDLRSAQAEVVSGYKKCLALQFRDSIPHFKRAQRLFRSVGDPWEAALAGYFVAYAQLNEEMVYESLAELNKAAEFARRGKYIWLEATVSYWLGGVNMKLGRHSEGRRAHEHALGLADRIQDSYSAQRNLLELARLGATSGQRSDSLGHIRRVLEENLRPGNSIRQRFRNFSYLTEIFGDFGLLHLAKFAGESAVNAAELSQDNFNVAMAKSKVGDVYIRLRQHDTAMLWIEGGLAAALSINDFSSRDKTSAFCYLKLADLEREKNKFDVAKQHYQRAIDFYRGAAMPYFLVQATSGLLLTEIALGNTAGIEQGIEENIQFAEQYRDQIADEREKSSYFDQAIDVYEIAAAFEFDRGNHEKAYDYAEQSSSRSLLDWLQKGTVMQKGGRGSGLVLPLQAEPKPLAKIRASMPADSQIVQFTLLGDRVLTWIISMDSFTARSIPVTSADLERKVADFRRSIEHRDDQTPVRSRELYDLLIAPIRDRIDASKEISLVPGGVLLTLPFAALASTDGQPLIAEYNISFAPSANVFLHITERAARVERQKTETVLAVGDPAFDREAFDRLPYLSGAEREAKQIASLYDQSVALTGAAASKQAVRRNIANADVLHFAGHYVVEPHAPMSSYLLLAESGDPDNSKLSNLELVEHDLSKAKVIVLAACRTGTESYSPGEGLIGLSRTFLGANVPLVIGSQWSVDSDATAELMTRFHRFRRVGGLKTTAALRAAQLEMINDPTGRYTAPYYWSAFAVYGGHAGF